MASSLAIATDFLKHFIEEHIDALVVLKIEEATMGVIVEPNDGHRIIEQSVKLRLTTPETSVQNAFNSARDMGKFNMSSGPGWHTLSMDTINGLNKVCGIERALKVDCVLADTVEGNCFRTGRGTGNENAPVWIVLEERNSSLARFFSLFIRLIIVGGDATGHA
jgi:hypothetical protein